MRRSGRGPARLSIQATRQRNEIDGNESEVSMLMAKGALLFLAFAAALHAQTVTGTILGAVADTSGARVAGALVTAVNELTQEKHSTASTATGDYLLLALPVGNYRVEVESQGFKKFIHRGVVLEINQNARV